MAVDPILEHKSVNPLPGGAAFVRNLKPSDFCVEGVRSQDALAIVQIVTDVAVALSAEKYGRPRFRVPAGRRSVTGENASETSPLTGNVSSERDSEAA